MNKAALEAYQGTSHDLALDLITALIEDADVSLAEREMVEMAIDGDWSWVENEYEPDGRAHNLPMPPDRALALLGALGIENPNEEERAITEAALKGDGNPACARIAAMCEEDEDYDP